MKINKLLLFTTILAISTGISVHAEGKTVTQTEEIYVEAGSTSDVLDMPMLMADDVYEDSFRNQLDDGAKELYDVMEEHYANEKETGSVQFEFENPLSFVAEVEEKDGSNVIIANEDYTATTKILTEQFQAALGAFIFDHPEVFWLRGMGLSYAMSGTWIEENTFRFYISVGTFVPTAYFNDAASMVDDFENGVEYAEEQIREIAGKDASDYEIAWAIRCWIGDVVSYNYDAAERGIEYGYGYAYTPYMVFVADDRYENAVVCEGYAKATKVLCDRFDVPCVLVIGNALDSDGTYKAHMWNYIQMPNEKWYAADVTWDDNIDEAYGYDETDERSSIYFLVGQNTKGIDATFGEEHFPSNYFTLNASKAFVYPNLSGDYYLDIEEGVEEFPIVVKGDITGDETVDMGDLVYMLRVVVKRVSVESLTDVQLEAADVADGDGEITMNDLVKLLRYVVKRIDSLD